MFLQPYEWAYSDLDDVANIRVWCHKKDTSEKVLLRINDYLPCLTVELPESLHEKKAFDSWIKHICLMLDDHEPVKWKIKQWKTLYYYSSKKASPFSVDLFFKSEDAKRHAKNLLNKPRMVPALRKKVLVIPRETSITTIIKYLTDHDQTFCQWIKVEDLEVPEDKLSTVEEYIVSHSSIEIICEEETTSWLTYPVAMGFDIEVYSENHDKFPNENFILNECYMISVIIKKLHTSDPIERILITTKDCEHIDNAQIIKVEDEIQGIFAFCDLIKEINPTILTGYNISSFDIMYMNARLDLYAEKWKSIGLLNDEITTMKTMTWSSSAYRQITMNYLSCEGRHFIDMFTLIRREHANLTDYKLDTVANHFLGKGKNPVTPKDMFEAYALDCPKRMAEVAEYCLIDSVICIDLMEKLNSWTHLTETSNIVNVSISDLFMRGQQIRVLNMVFRWANKAKFVLDSREETSDGKYKGATVVTPIPGLHENVIILDFASLYPSIMIAYNICHTTLIKEGVKIPDEMVNTFEWEQEGVKHKHRFIKKEIFKGIIPTIAEHLLRARSQIKKKMKQPNISEFTYNLLDARQKGLKVSANSIYGTFGAGKTGKLPLLEGGEVITAKGRELIDMSIKYVADEYNGKTVYGDTDSIMVNVGLEDPEKRKWMCDRLGITDYEDLNEGHLHLRVGEGIEEDICKIYEKPLRLELEGVAKYILSLRKKKYAKLMFDDKTGLPETDNDGDIKLQLKGVPCVRRDNSKWVREQYYQALKLIIKGGKLEDVKKLIKDTTMDLIEGRVNDDDLVITAQMGRVYDENSNYVLKIFADNMRRMGYPVSTSERFSYVIVESESKKKGDKMRLYDQIYKSGSEKIDIPYYINKVAGGNIDKLLFLAFYNTDTTGEFGASCKCGKKSDIVYSPCGHKCVCSLCFEEYKIINTTCCCGFRMPEVKTGDKCSGCHKIFKRQRISCELCDKTVTIKHCKLDISAEDFNSRSEKYKFMRKLA